MTAAVLLSIAAIVLALVAMSRAASASAEIRSLTRRLDAADRALRAARKTPSVDATEVQPADSAPNAAELEVAQEVAGPRSRADEFAETVSRRLEADRAAHVETHAASTIMPPVLPVQAETTAVPPPLPRAPERRVAHHAAKPAAPLVGNWIKRLGPNDPSMSWEMALGTYWLPRIGAIALAAAIVFLLSLAFQKWGPPIRVGLGYAVAAALLGTGWKLDRKFPAYARVLSALGIALTYFVTFATYFVPYAQIFDTPYPSLAGLAAVVVVWAALAQRRHSPILAGITLGLGHFTIALATYALASPGPYTVAGIVFLSLGGAYFLARNGWYVVAALGLVASYANHFYLMTQVEPGGTPLEFAVGLGILSTYFLVYTVAEMIAPDSMRRERFPFWFRNAFAVGNTLAFLLLGTILMVGYDFARDEQHLFRYGLAIALLVVAILYLRVRKGDPLYNTYFVKGISAATWGLATQFDAHVLSTGLAIETALLLFAARRSGLLVTRLMAYGVGAFAFVQTAYTLLDAPTLAYEDPAFTSTAVQAAIVLVAFQFAAWLYRYTDWSVRSPSRTIFSDDTNAALWQLDLFSTLPEGHSARKPLQGHLYPYLFSAAGAIAGATYAEHLFATDDEPVAIAALALVFTLLAVVLRMRAFGLAALVFFAGALIADTSVGWDTPIAKAVPAIAMLGVVAFATESRYLGDREGLTLFRLRAMPYILYGFVALLVALHIDSAIESDERNILAIGGVSLMAAAGAILLHRRALAWCAIGLLAWAQLHWLRYWYDPAAWYDPATGAYIAITWALIAVGFAGERYFTALRVPIAGPVALTLSALTFAAYILFDAASGWVAVWWAAGGIALLAISGATRGRTPGVLGVIGLAAASLNQIGASLNWPLEMTPLVLGFVVPALGWVALERGAKVLIFRVGMKPELETARVVLPAIATALLALMLFKLPQATTYYLTLSWCGLGIFLFVFAVAFKEKAYRFCGLAILGLATLRAALIDTRELEALPRVFALGGLGLVLLALGFAYVRVFARTKNAEVVGENL